MIRPLRPLVAAAVLAVTVQSASPAAAAHPPASGDSVRAWNSITVDTLVEAGPAAVPGPVGPLYLAYVHRAVYDAVGRSGHHTSVPAAVATAAHRVLNFHFPAQNGRLDRAYARALKAIPDGAAQDRGVAIGKAAARAVLRNRANDGLNGTPLPLPKLAPGVWRPAVADPPITAAAASWLGKVRPFVLRSPAQFRPGPPPALTSARYARDFREVKIHGSSKSTVTAETDVGLFWSDPPSVQSQAALRLLADRRNMNAKATARLFALANTASADSLIACADAKFRYNFWRPYSAIPLAGRDRNPATVPDRTWTPVAPSPNFPEYPSNHGCATTAIALVVDALDGSSPFRFTMTSVNATNRPTKTFTSAEQMIREVGNARVWGGIHFRFSVEAGTAIGRAVAARVLHTMR
jgi:hypothetical protein